MSRVMRTALTTLLVAACGTEPSMEIPGNIETATFAAALEVDLGASSSNQAGLYWRDITVGTGPVVTAGQAVDVYYTGWLKDGTRFDGTTVGDPFTFQVGVGGVIAGWDQGVVGMHVGGKRQLIIPPALGYGTRGAGGVIPPDAILVFTVEVLEAR